MTRGRDWKWGEQDGGSGRIGAIQEITAWSGVERSGAKVVWNLLSKNTYRTGHMGEVGFAEVSFISYYSAVTLDKKLYSTLSLFTQVYKWVPAIIMLGGNVAKD